MGVLAVDLDQLGGRLGQGAHRGHAPVDPRPRAAVRRHGAGDDDLAFTLGRTDHEARLDQGLGGPRPDDGRIGPAPQHQLERLDHQRLARAGLAGQDRHARAEGQRQVLDDAEVAHPQLGQHGRLLLAIGQQPEPQQRAEAVGVVAHHPHRPGGDTARDRRPRVEAADVLCRR